MIADNPVTPKSLHVAGLEREQQRATWADAPFDGVLGTPPEWVPLWYRNNFARARNLLLETPIAATSPLSPGTRPHPSQVKAWLEGFEEHGPPPELAQRPQRAALGALWVVWRAVASGADELQFFGGHRRSRARRRRPGIPEAETVYIASFLKKHWNRSVGDLWRDLHVVARSPFDPRNPTPGSCPLMVDATTEPAVLLKRGRPFTRRAFEKMIYRLKEGLR